MDPIESSNTAVAVKSVAEGGRSDLAAIGSADAARIYGLSVIESGIASSSTNTTRYEEVATILQLLLVHMHKLRWITQWACEVGY